MCENKGDACSKQMSQIGSSSKETHLNKHTSLMRHHNWAISKKTLHGKLVSPLRNAKETCSNKKVSLLIGEVKGEA
jgi:hypothetical protein